MTDVFLTLLTILTTTNMAASIASFFTTTLTAASRDSDRFILAPESFHPTARDDPNIVIQPDEFKLYGKQYIRCSALAKPPKHTKKRTSIVWTFGEDIQLRKESEKKFWYCYICEKERRRQELPVAGKGNSTALDHLQQVHHIDRVTGDHKPPERAANQPSITQSVEGWVRRLWGMRLALRVRALRGLRRKRTSRYSATGLRRVRNG